MFFDAAIRQREVMKMKKFVLAILFLFCAMASSIEAAEDSQLSIDGASDKVLRERIIQAIKDHVTLKQEVINGKIPIKLVVNTSQDDAELKDQIERAISEGLKKHDDVIIAPPDGQAWLWISVATTTGDFMSMSCAYGKYENSTLWKRDDDINILSERKFFINHFVALMAKNDMEDQISALMDAINTWLLEPVRGDREDFLRFQDQSS
jgi:hypothetical protein